MSEDEESSAEITAAFHRLYYGSEQRTWRTTKWLGVEVQKCPLDLWIYQELLTATRPDVVLETGTWQGGSALFLASVFDCLGAGRVITVDVHPHTGQPQHPRIEYVVGSSTDPAVSERVLASIAAQARVMVILDSDHSCSHVVAELERYAPRVTPGCYLVVEDTNVNGRPVLPDYGPGPFEAVQAFLVEHPEFEVDEEYERFWMTFNPGGYLRRGDVEALR